MSPTPRSEMWTQELPIARAQMRVRVAIPEAKAKDIKKKIEPMVATLEKEDWDFDYEMVV